MSAAADLERKVHAKIDELEDELIKVALDLSDVDAAPCRSEKVKSRRRRAWGTSNTMKGGAPSM